MNKQFDDSNRGALFKNDKKVEAVNQGDADAETWADYNGSLNCGGHDYWINAWVKTSKNGRKFFSLSVKLKDGGPQRKPDTKTAAQEMDDEIPF